MPPITVPSLRYILCALVVKYNVFCVHIKDSGISNIACNFLFGYVYRKTT